MDENEKVNEERMKEDRSTSSFNSYTREKDSLEERNDNRSFENSKPYNPFPGAGTGTDSGSGTSSYTGNVYWNDADRSDQVSGGMKGNGSYTDPLRGKDPYRSNPYTNTAFGSTEQGSSYGSAEQGNSYGGAQRGSLYGNTQQGNSYRSAQQGDSYSTDQHRGAYGRYEYRTPVYQEDEKTGTDEPRKKRSPVAVTVAVLLIVTLICGAACGGYYAVSHGFDFFGSDDREIAQTPSIDDNGEDKSSGNKEDEKGSSDKNKDGDESAGSKDDTSADKAGKDQTVSTTTAVDNAAIVTDVTQVVKNVMPSIVSIDNNYKEQMSYFGYSMGEQEVTASGSGIIIGKNDKELLIVTNNHVIASADTLKVNFIDGSKKEANIKGTNADMDLAVIAVPMSSLSNETVEAIAIATLGDSENLQMGEPAIAIGNALGYGQSVTTGVISANNRVVKSQDGTEGTFIQTDAAINPGNSGGALLNARGEVIGINSSKFASQAVEGMGFAIPISVAKPIIDGLMNEETMIKVDSENRGYLGVTVYTPTGVEGAYVASVGSGSAAEKGGIQAGDIITGIGDKEITSRDDLVGKLAYYEAGQKVKVTVLRKKVGSYETVEVEVTLQSKEEANSALGEEPGSEDGAEDGSGAGQEPGNQMPGGDNGFGFGFGF
jgi:serine protease Do